MPATKCGIDPRQSTKKAKLSKSRARRMFLGQKTLRMKHMLKILKTSVQFNFWCDLESKLPSQSRNFPEAKESYNPVISVGQSPSPVSSFAKNARLQNPMQQLPVKIMTNLASKSCDTASEASPRLKSKHVRGSRRRSPGYCLHGGIFVFERLAHFL